MPKTTAKNSPKPEKVHVPKLADLEALDEAVSHYMDIESRKPDLCTKCGEARAEHSALMKEAWAVVREAHSKVHSNQVSFEFDQPEEGR